jgi:hypothetical protein
MQRWHPSPIAHAIPVDFNRTDMVAFALATALPVPVLVRELVTFAMRSLARVPKPSLMPETPKATSK